MARRPKNNLRSEGRNNGDWRAKIHYINFSANDEKEIATWHAKGDYNWHTCLEEIIDDGWAIKITPPGDRDNFTCSISCRQKEDTAHGHTFVISYPGFDGAILLAYYLFSVCYKRGELDQYVAEIPSGFLNI